MDTLLLFPLFGEDLFECQPVLSGNLIDLSDLIVDQIDRCSYRQYDLDTVTHTGLVLALPCRTRFVDQSRDLMGSVLDGELMGLCIVTLEGSGDQVGIGKSAVLCGVELSLVTCRVEVSGIVVIDRMAVGFGHHTGIVGRLGTTLDLERVNHAAIEYLVDMGSHVHIFGVHDVCADPLLLIEAKGGTGLGVVRIDLVWKAAVVRTASAVGDASCLECGDQAAAAVGKTHRPVHKDLQLHIGQVVLDRFTILKADLTCDNNTLDPKIVVDLRIHRIHHVRLCGEVYGDIGCDTVGDLHHPRRGDDERIGLKLGDLGDMVLIEFDL